MKIILAILGIGFIGVLVLGFLFVRWANQPEQVADGILVLRAIEPALHDLTLRAIRLEQTGL